MTRVLHYLDTWLPLSASFVHRAVARSRHDTVVVTRCRPQHLEVFPHPRVVSLQGVVPPLPARASAAAFRLAAWALTAAYRADVVHVHFGYPLPDLAHVLRRRRVPVAVSLHGHDATALPLEQPGYYGKLLSLVDAVVVPSRFLASCVERLGVPAGRVVVIPSGVDVDAFAVVPPPAGPPVALFVGRLVEKKGIDVLIEAWPQVLAAVPGARLKLLGDGPLAPLVRGVPRVELEPPDPVRPGEQVRAAMAAATVIVTPSRTARSGDAESLLVVNLEAQAAGRPVVTTNHGGIPEFVVDGRTALVVPEGDAPRLASALVTVLCDPDLAGRLGASGRQWARKFDSAETVRRFDELHQRLVDGPSP